MAIAKRTAEKKSETQPAEKTETKVETKAPAEKIAPKLTSNKLCRDLLLERAYSDDQINDKVKAVFPDSKFNKAYVSTTRIDMNKGYYKGIEEDLTANPIQRLVESDGKVISYDEERAQKIARAEADKAEKAAVMQTKKKASDVRTGNPIGASAVKASEKPALKPIKKSSKKALPKK